MMDRDRRGQVWQGHKQTEPDRDCLKEPVFRIRMHFMRHPEPATFGDTDPDLDPDPD